MPLRLELTGRYYNHLKFKALFLALNIVKSILHGMNIAWTFP